VTPHDATIAFYAASALTGLGLEFLATRPASRIPTFGAVLRRVGHTRSGRVGLLAGWAWLGLHFFAR
jgi:Family of unknown function (DUF6186)